MKQFILFLILSFSFFKGIAQTGEIAGTVSDNKEALPFADVSLRGTAFSASTDMDGRFRLTAIPAGTYTLEVSLLGYSRYARRVSVTHGEKSEVNIRLEESDEQLDEIVLTGVTRQTSIRENPIAVRSLTAKQLDLTPESNIVDVMVQKTPGMSAVKTGPNISKPYIRGLGYNRVLTLYDGIRQEGQQWGDEHGLEMDTYNIERAEVIKGPSSLMYGSDAIAGVVSFFPAVPKMEDGQLHGKFTSEYQTNNGLIGDGLTIGFNDGKYLMGLSSSYRMANNYRNPIDGRVYQSNFREKTFSALLGHQSEKGQSFLKFTLFDDQQAIPEGDRDVDGGTRRFMKEYFGHNNELYGEFIPASKKELSSYSLPDLHQHIQHYRAYLKSHYEVGEGEIDFSLSGTQNIRIEYDNPETPGAPAMKVRLNTMSYALRYDAPEFAHIEASVGINGMAQNNKSIDASDFPIPDYDLVETGAFLYAKWKRHNWTFSGGIRYDLRHVKWGDFWIDEHPVTGFDEHISAPRSENSELLYESTKRNLNGVTGSFGTTYRINDHLSLKANFGRAYRAPNITELAANDLDPGASIIYRGNADFEPEFSSQFDLGLSGEYADFSFEISGFHNNIQNFIYLSRGIDERGVPLVDEDGNREYWYQQASAKLYGGELWLSFHPKTLEGARWDNGLSYVRGLNRDKDLKNEKRNGQYLPDIPPFKWLSTVSYDLHLSSQRLRSIRPQVEMELSAAQNEYFGRNDTETKTSGYVLWNAGLQSQWKYAEKAQPLTFMVQVNNLWNKAYQDHLNRLKYMDTYLDDNEISPNGRYGIYNMGRNVIFKAVFPF